VAGFAAVLAVNAVNPDAVIARTNIERARYREELDAYYLTTLSADAVPMLVEALLRIRDRCIGSGYTLEQALLDR
jgi:two-component system, OmpR family, sensor histidine kinase BaeS